MASSVNVKCPRISALTGRDTAVDVVVTRGAAGVAILGQSDAHIPGRDVDAVDPTSAGDAFVGALSFGLLRGWGLRRAAEAANAVAAHAVTQVGPRLRSLPDELGALLTRH